MCIRWKRHGWEMWPLITKTTTHQRQQTITKRPCELAVKFEWLGLCRCVRYSGGGESGRGQLCHAPKWVHRWELKRKTIGRIDKMPQINVAIYAPRNMWTSAGALLLHKQFYSLTSCVLSHTTEYFPHYFIALWAKHVSHNKYILRFSKWLEARICVWKPKCMREKETKVRERE